MAPRASFSVGRRLHALLLAGLFLIVATVAPASAAQSGEVVWQLVGEPPEGTWQIASDGDDALTLFALGPSGILKSDNLGRTWAECNKQARSMSSVRNLDGPMRLFSTTAVGLRVSDDACATWRDVPASSIQPSSAHVRMLIPYPNNPEVLYALMDGLGGIYRSIDGGATWLPSAGGLPPGAWVTALTADPQEPSTLWVGVRYATRNFPQTYIYKSLDGGVTWKSSSLGLNLLPNNKSGILSLVWSGETLFAATRSDGLFELRRGANHWKEATLPRRVGATTRRLLPGLPEYRPLPLEIMGGAVTQEGALLLQTAQGLYLSVDGAVSWKGIGPSDALARSDIFLDRQARRVILFAQQGMWSTVLPAFVVTQPSVVPITATPPPPTPPLTANPYTPTPTRTPTSTPTNTPVPTPSPTLVPGPHPSDRVGPLDAAIADYYPETGHNVAYGFRDWFRNNGGVGFLGYPLTEEFVEGGVPVQYFERGRLEYRDGKVSLARLAAELFEKQEFPKPRPFTSTETNFYFDVTGYSVSGPFLSFWREYGGLSTMGYPLSESFIVEGKDEYQWFERARLEFHPSFPEGKRIVLGQIGKEALQKRGWIR